MGERGSSQHPCQCGLLGRAEAASLIGQQPPARPLIGWLGHHVEAPDKVLSPLLSMPHSTLQDLASSQCASLSHNNNKDREQSDKQNLNHSDENK